MADRNEKGSLLGIIDLRKRGRIERIEDRMQVGLMESLFFITKSYAFRYNSMHPITIIPSGNVSNSIDCGRLAVHPHTSYNY